MIAYTTTIANIGAKKKGASMKINVKQVWDVELPKTMTLLQLKEMAEAIQNEGDACVLKFNGTNYIARRISE